MHVHRNATTTPKGRALLVQRVTELGWSMRTAASASGVSLRTGYKWLARYRAEGTAGFADRSCAPHARPRRTRPRLEQWILGLRAHRLSGRRIAHRTGIARATVGHVLRRHGLGRLPGLMPKPAVRHYECASPLAALLQHAAPAHGAPEPGTHVTTPGGSGVNNVLSSNT